VIPVVFVLDEEEGVIRLYWAVDQKPKATTDIQRLRNISANPAVEVVVDSYEEDWDGVWWVRLTGVARIIEDVSEREAALARLGRKYPQYAASPPEGAVVAIEVQRVSTWEAREGNPSETLRDS
jgi:PPOX class probable F420-dependent enzyme